jgi:colanic acid biosynthesis protein WcaH
MTPVSPLDPSDFAQVIRAAPLVSIDLLVSDEQGQVLLGRRSNAPARGMWFVPGGRIHKGERLDQALERVILEELGPEAAPATVEFHGIFDHIYEENFFGDPDYGTHFVVLAHRVVLERVPQNLPQAQHHEFRWWAIAQLLASGEVHPYTKAYFR